MEISFLSFESIVLLISKSVDILVVLIIYYIITIIIIILSHPHLDSGELTDLKQPLS